MGKGEGRGTLHELWSKMEGERRLETGRSKRWQELPIVRREAVRIVQQWRIFDGARLCERNDRAVAHRAVSVLHPLEQSKR